MFEYGREWVTSLRGLRATLAPVAATAFVVATAVVPTGDATAQEFQQGGTVVAAITGDPPMLTSMFGANILAVTISGQLHDTLIKLDAQMNIEPALAESWDISEDGLTYTFNLRDDVTWHDGVPFTSDDVAYTFTELTRQYNSLANATYSVIADIETPDPHTVILHLTAPDPAFFPWAFSQTNFAQIFPRHIYEGTDPRDNPNNFAPVGTGPFVFREWVRGSHIVLDRNPDYFEPVYLDRAVFQVIPEPGSRQLALEQGDVDYLPYFALAPASIDALAANPDTEVIDAMRPPLGEIIMFINVREEPLSNVDVRRALAYATDRPQIVDLALAGRATPATGPIRSDQLAFYNPEIERYERDVARANEMLDAAGYPRGSDGTRFTIRLSYEAAGEGGAFQSAAEILREQYREIGVALQLEPSDSATWQERAFIRWDFDLAMGSFGTGPDPAIGVARLYITENIIRENAHNLSGYSNPEVDELFRLAARELDTERRRELYQQVQAILVDELPAIWLWEKFYPIAVRTGLVGMPSGAMHSEPWSNVGWVE